MKNWIKRFGFGTVVCDMEEILKTVRMYQGSLVAALTDATAPLVCNQLLLKKLFILFAVKSFPVSRAEKMHLATGEI